MTGPSFRNIGPFVADLTWEERWSRVGLLDQACRGVPEAEPALAILHRGCHTIKRRSEALMILDGMPSRSLRGVLSRYGVLAGRRKAA